MKNRPATSLSPDERKQYMQFIEKNAAIVLEDNHLDRRGLYELLAKDERFRSYIAGGIRELSVSDRYRDEEVFSPYTYPDGFTIKSPEEQIAILRKFFPGLGSAYMQFTEQSLPTFSEGWFAIPRWGKVGSSYNDAFKKVLDLLAVQRKFRHYFLQGQLGVKCLRRSEHTIAMVRSLITLQRNCDIVIFPAQFGLRHAGRSTRRARELFTDNEFGLSAYATGIMLLTHPERESDWEQLHIDCAGDEFAEEEDTDFICAPSFSYRAGVLECDAAWNDRVSPYYGSISAFLP